MHVTDMFKFLFSFWLAASGRQYLREGLHVEQGFFSLPTCTKAPGCFYLTAFLPNIFFNLHQNIFSLLIVEAKPDSHN